MRALAKLQKGILRVENPPFSKIEPLMKNGTSYLKIKIRFAFDASKMAAGLGRTVSLQLKSSANPSLASSAPTDGVKTVPSFDSVKEMEANHVKNVQSIVVSSFEFDLVKAIPDSSISSLRSGNPIKYDYIKAVPSPQTTQINEKVDSLSIRDYLISKLKSGIDPATLRENFPVSDPTKKAKAFAQVGVTDSYFTKPAERLSSYQKMFKYSKYAIFEDDIEVSLNDFISATTYEFSYLAPDKTPQEFVEVKINANQILTQLEKLEYTKLGEIDFDYKLDNQNPYEVKYVKNVKSTDSLVSTEFVETQSNAKDSSPKVIRKHYRKSNKSNLTPAFESKVIGLPSKMNKTSNLHSLNKSFVIPFYVDASNMDVNVKITKLPPHSNRVSVLAKNITKKELVFSEIVSASTKSKSNAIINVGLLKADCIYEFKVACTDLKMRSTISSNSVTLNYKTPYTEATLSVSQPSFIGNQNVKFNITSVLSDAGRKDIINLIEIAKSSGISQQILDQYLTDPSYYTNIFSCRVEKIDLDTGIQSYTKEIPIGEAPTEYIDRSSSSNGSVYIFTLGVRDPISLLPNQPDYKWGAFGGRPLISLPSKKSLKNSAISGVDFSVIDSGIKKIIFVPTTLLRGAITSINLSKTMRDSNLLEWTYKGDITEVDHFQVIGSADGVECLLGCSFRSNSFEDAVLFDRLGVVTYKIRPIYITMEPGEIFSISVKNNSTLPSIISENFSNGQLWRVPITAVNSSLKVLDNNSSTLHSPIQQIPKQASSSQITSSKVSFVTKIKPEIITGLSSITTKSTSSPMLEYNLEEVVDGQILTPSNAFSLESSKKFAVNNISDNVIVTQSSTAAYTVNLR